MWGDTTLESVSWGDSIDGPLDIRPLVVKFLLLLSILDIHIFHFPLKIFGQIHQMGELNCCKNVIQTGMQNQQQQ